MVNYNSCLMISWAVRNYSLAFHLSSTSDALITDIRVPMRTWLHICAMFNSSGAILYVDGEKRSHAQRKSGKNTDDYFAVSIPSCLYKRPA